MRRQLRPALLMFVVATVALGLLYPLAVTAAAQVTMGDRANGSLVEVGGEAVGSSLIGQSFTDPSYFLPRPSAAGDGYDGTASGGSNLGPTNEELLTLVEERALDYRELNGLEADDPVPVDAVTASGSGLDPHISVANAALQAPRVAAERDLPLDEVLALVDANTQPRSLGVLGEDGVNVLPLNIALDEVTT